MVPKTTKLVICYETLIFFMSNKNLKQIAVSNENYAFLKTQGQAGDSFNDVINKLRIKVCKHEE